VIGSFKTQENYRAVLSSIQAFRNEGWTVTSPAGSPVIKAGVDFVRFTTDIESASDAEVQSRTLERIMGADLTFVTAPNGYVGRTTCYEIGRLVQARRPLFFSELPKDLPIQVDATFVGTAEVVARGYRNRRAPTLFELGGDFASELERRLIDD
jgi:hypothetical protein